MGKIGVRGLDHARASARSTGMFLAALVFALCALMMGAHDAYAITVRDDGNGYKRAIVYPHDYPNGRYAALAEFLGYDWDSFSQQTKTAIIEDDGKFMELYRARCKNYRYENQDLQDGSGSLIGTITTTLANVVNSVSETVFGNDKTWYCSCTNEDYETARANIEQWLYPNDGTSGGSGASGSLATEITLDNCSGQWNYYGTVISSSGSLTMTMTETQVDLFRNNGYYYVYGIIYLKHTYYGIDGTGGYCFWSDKPINFSTSEVNSQTVVNCTSEGIIYSSEVTNHRNINFNNGYRWSGSFPMNSSGSAHGNSYSVTCTARNAQTQVIVDNFEDSGPVIEPYEPTPDPTPTPPVIQIGDVTIDLSNGPYTVNNVTYTAVLDNENNWTIQITSNTTNNYGGDVQAADPTDYTSILNAILAAINSLRSEMTTYSNQINTAINTMSTNIQTAIKNADTSISGHIKKLNEQVHADIQTLQTNLQNNFNGKFDAYTTQLWSNMAALDADLLEAIHDAAVYVVDGLYWDGGMDDGEVVKWLKMIYSRLKDKKVSLPSVDEDPKGWLDRLKDILDELLNVILSGVNVATLATTFEGLKARFPISIPWDIAAIVNMFAGGAVTPVFDLPLPNGTNGSYTTVHVDLHEWDDEMALVRQGELLLFGIVLMYNTKWMFDTVTMTFRRGE